jgi:hypothetical protein
MKKEIKHISELQIIGDPLFMVVTRSETADAFHVMEFMTQRR